MIPWPVALLTLCYGIVAALSGATLWEILLKTLDRPLVWPAAWLVLSGAAMIGLPLLKSWARTTALIGLAWMILTMLVLAWGLAVGGHGMGGLLATIVAGVLLIPVRYLRRPHVKSWFTKTVDG